MKRHLVFFFVLLSWLVPAAMAQPNLKDQVVIIKPTFHASSVKFLEDFSKWLRKDGYTEAADVLLGYSQGGFGTGFLYKDPTTGRFFVLTNRHVVALAESASIVFERPDGEQRTYEKCEILAVDPRLDIAAVALPSYFSSESFLTFSDAAPADGQDVFAAGFPGLGDRPSWQLTKGIVSNASVCAEGFIDSAMHVRLLQHTAPIDPGSSGSPLLVKDQDGNFQVVGINTYKAQARENANFAIPVRYLEAFIAERLNVREQLVSKAALEQQALLLTNASTDYYRALVPALSYEWIAKITPSDFNEWYDICPKPVCEAIVAQFADMNPVEGVRIALAYMIAKSASTKGYTQPQVERSDGAHGQVSYMHDEAKTMSGWGVEQGEWRLMELEGFSVKSSGRTGLATSFGYRRSLFVGFATPFAPGIFDLSVGYGSTIRTFVTYDVALRFGQVPLKDNPELEKTKYFGFDISLGGQLPLRLGPLYLIPYIKPFVGMAIKGPSLSYGGRTGLELAYKVGNSSYLFLGVGYRLQFFKDVLKFEDEYAYPDNQHAFDMRLGVGF